MFRIRSGTCGRPRPGRASVAGQAMSPTPARSSRQAVARDLGCRAPVTGITSVETASGLFERAGIRPVMITSATRATSDAGPAKWSRIACRFVPPPDAKTAILMARFAASGKASR